MKRLRRTVFFAMSFGFLAAHSMVHAEETPKEPQVPAQFAFVRSLDVDGYVQRTSDHGLGSQSLRMRLRYRDPDVNAFVGLLTGVTHFNRDLYLGTPTAPDTSNMPSKNPAIAIVMAKSAKGK